MYLTGRRIMVFWDFYLKKGFLIGKLNIENPVNNWNGLPVKKIQNIEDNTFTHHITYIKRRLSHTFGKYVIH